MVTWGGDRGKGLLSTSDGTGRRWCTGAGNQALVVGHGRLVGVEERGGTGNIGPGAAVRRVLPLQVMPMPLSLPTSSSRKFSLAQTSTEDDVASPATGGAVQFR